jgi:hypothetical protein
VSYELNNQPAGMIGFDFPVQEGVKDLCLAFR